VTERGGVTRVVVVAERPADRVALMRVLEADGDIRVVGQAGSAPEAAALVERLRPHVVAVDLLLPGRGGQEAVERIMGRSPTPVLVLCPPRPDAGAGPAVEAMRAGALGAFAHPVAWTVESAAQIRRRVRVLRGATVVRHPRRNLAIPGPPARSPGPDGGRASPVVAIAASTGGPAALAEVLAAMGGVNAPVLVIQHIHPDFVGGLVEWMRRVAGVDVRLAVHGARLQRGVAYVGPGGVHLKVGPDRRLVLDPEPEARHRPSADELFMSVAEHVGAGAVGVVLTGMGDDGAEGLLAIRRRGGLTVAQDEQTSAVYGMPQAARLAGAVSCVLPLDRIGPAVVAATLRVGR
jgi:two-component system chemotaxis response regulator CheB